MESLEAQYQGLEKDDFISSQVYKFRLGQIKAMLNWLEECRDSLPG
jgi:hypothetical protein